jgi:hypothetical protein
LAKANELAVKGVPMSQNEISRLEFAGPSRLARREHFEADTLYLRSIYVGHGIRTLLTGCVMASLTERN